MAALRDVSVILLAFEAMLVMLIPAVAVGATWYGVRWLRRKLPPLFAQARKYLALGQFYVKRASMAVVAPLIAAYALAAQLGAWWNFLMGLVQEKN
jgi:hypothetical protein